MAHCVLKMQFSFGWERGEEIDEFQTLGQSLLIGLTNAGRIHKRSEDDRSAAEN